jgi:Flp pilus assembly protein TadD
MLASLSFDAHDCKAAFFHFRKATSEVSRNPLALHQMGYCLFASANHNEAARVFQRVLELQPSNDNARLNLAEALNGMGSYREAIAILRPLVEAPKPRPDVLSVMAVSLSSMGEIQQAITTLRRAIELAPRDERYYLDLAALFADHSAQHTAADV